MGRAKVVLTFRGFHTVEFTAHHPILAPKKHLAERMAVRRKHPAGMDGHRQQPWPCKSPRRRLMIRATVKAKHPCLRTTEYFAFASSHDHLPRRIKSAYAGENHFRIRRLVGNKGYPECSRLAIDPFMKAATHPAAAIVKDFDSVDLFR